MEHVPEGDPCALCGLPFVNHRKGRLDSERAYYVGIDGEGQGRDVHRYVMLAWSDEERASRNAIQAAEGCSLTTAECLDFILAIPGRAKIFAYAFNYDLTKMLTDVDDGTLYYLFRPELRQYTEKQQQQYKFRLPRPVKWNGYKLNLMSSKFVVERGGRRKVIWDVFKFFQTKFTGALEDWHSKEVPEGTPLAHPTVTSKTGFRLWDPPEMGPVVEHMTLMKNERARFDQLGRDRILDYCYDECAYMATLARRLTEAHEKAGLKLRSYYGAGSTASAVLKKMGIDKCNRETPEEMVDAVSRAFFGGRFEHDVIGPVEGAYDPDVGKNVLWGYDISSAYPYQLTFLPCLDCGRWEHTTDRNAIDNARTAVVRYNLGEPPPDMHWAPFPFRTKTGAIAFPATSGGGWVWREEYRQGERLWPHVGFREAWVYHCDCDHQPFAQIPRFYIERLRIGKEGPGIVLKLGVNACYGKLAQSVGLKPPFRCWIWAGMITSGTRAQLLEMLGLHKDRRNMLAVATDGIYSREKIEAPKPRPTVKDSHWFDLLKMVGGSEHARTKALESDKPLGGWERTRVDNGMFFARPGIYFPLKVTEKEVKKVRARGVGRGMLFQSCPAIMEAYAAGQSECKIADVSRFHGAKSSIGRVPIEGQPGHFVYRRYSDDETGRPRYGQWTTKPVKLDFTPLPKRESRRPDGTMVLRSFPGQESGPYRRSSVAQQMKIWAKHGLDAVNKELVTMKLATEEAIEQPDGGDYVDYEKGGPI